MISGSAILSELRLFSHLRLCSLSCPPCLCAANHQTTRLFPNVSHLVTSLLLIQTYCVLDLDYFRSLFPGFLPLICSPCSCPIQCHRLQRPQTSFYCVIHSHAQKPSKVLPVTFQKLNSKSSRVLTMHQVVCMHCFTLSLLQALGSDTSIISILRKFWCRESPA